MYLGRYPRAYAGCTCACHNGEAGSVQHVAACCSPDDEIAILNSEITSLRAQAEELSKYPEEAVRAVFDMGVTAGMSSAKHAIDPAQNYGKLKDKISAIFKEKQGEVK